MNNKLFIVGIVSLLTFGSIGVAIAAPNFIYQTTILPQSNNAFDLGTTTGKNNSGIWRNMYSNTASTTNLIVSGLGGATGCLTPSADGTISTTACSGGSGSGTVSTSTVPTVGNLSYWTSNGFPSLLGSVATGTISNGTGISVTAGQSVIGSGLTITNTAPDQTVAFTDGIGISVTGTYPNFTVTNTAPQTFSYLFPNNATSTLIDFQGGIKVGTLSGLGAWNSGTPYEISTSSPVQMDITGNAGTVTNGVYTTGAGTVFENPLTFNYPITRATNAISLAFGTTTANSWNQLQTFANSSTTGTATVNQLCFPSGQCMSNPVAAGSSFTLYPWNVATDIASYKALRTEPDSGTEVDDNCSATSGYCAGTLEINVSTTTLTATGPLVINKIPAGTWGFDTYAYVNVTSGASSLEYTLFRRTSGGTETQLFQATTSTITNTTVGLVQVLTTQPSFAFDPTDRLVMKVRGYTTSGAPVAIHYVYEGMQHYSHVDTPITIASEAIAFLPANNTFTGTNAFTITPSFASSLTGLVGANAGTLYSSAATTTVSCSGSVSCTQFTAIGASPIIITASAGATVVSTSTNETAGSLAYWTSTSGTPALLGKVSTTTPSFGLGLTAGGTWNVLGSAPTLNIATSSLYSGTTGQLFYFAGTNAPAGTSTASIAPNGTLTLDNGLAGDAWTQYGATAHEWSVGAKISDYSFRISSSTSLGTNDALTIDKNLKLTVAGVFAISTTTAGCLNISGAGTVYSATCASGTVTAVTASAPLQSSGGTTPNITWTGLATTSQPAASNLLTSNGGSGVYGTGTTTPTLGIGLTGTLTTINNVAQSLNVATSSFYSGTTGQLPYFSGTNALTATSSLFIAAGGNIGVGSSTPNYLFSVGTSGSQFAVNASGTIMAAASQPATSTAMTLDWSATPNTVEYQLGTSATTITVINATNTPMWGSRKLIQLWNPGASAGAITFRGVMFASAYTQTTAANRGDLISCVVTHATSTTAYIVLCTAGVAAP